MKLKSGLIALFVFTTIVARAQEKNTFSLFYGISNSNVDIHGVIGDYGYDQLSGTGFGLTYDKALNKFFFIETGFTYADDKSEFNSILFNPGTGRGDFTTPVEMKTVSVPLRAKFAFLRYLFADAGISLDKQTNYTASTTENTNNQSGLGAEIGIGAQINFSHLLVFVNPYYRNYRITSTQNTLYEEGLKFGLGFKF